MQRDSSPFPTFGHRKELRSVTSFFHFQFRVFSSVPELQQVGVLYFRSQQTFIHQGLSPQESGFLLFPVGSIHLYNWTKSTEKPYIDPGTVLIVKALKTYIFIYLFILVVVLFFPTAADSQGKPNSHFSIP